MGKDGTEGEEIGQVRLLRALTLKFDPAPETGPWPRHEQSRDAVASRGTANCKMDFERWKRCPQVYSFLDLLVLSVSLSTNRISGQADKRSIKE
jgi:hypothetical protein